MSELQRGLRAKMGIIYDDAMPVSIELQTLYDICKELQNTSSTLEKQNILKRYKNNKLFKEVLKFLLDPMIVTGISKKKIDKKTDPTNLNISLLEVTTKSSAHNLRDLLNYVKEHNTGTDIDIA